MVTPRAAAAFSTLSGSAGSTQAAWFTDRIASALLANQQANIEAQKRHEQQLGTYKWRLVNISLWAQQAVNYLLRYA
jgi:hypothetical protein